MLLIIYTFTAFSLFLIFFGLVHLQLKKLEEEYTVSGKSTFLFERFKPLIRLLAFYNQKLNFIDFEKKYRKKLLISGNQFNLVPMEFLAIKQLSLMGGLLFGLFLHYEISTPWLGVIFIGVGSFFLPELSLIQTTAERKKKIFLEQPFYMDLLALSMEAGLGFIMAIEKVVQHSSPGPMHNEFNKLLRDLRLGVTMRDALNGIAERVDTYEIRAFTSALVQADKLGAPLAEALMMQSEIRRNARFQKAEKLAQEAPIKILFPLLFFIFPAVFIIILVPILLEFSSKGM